MGVYKRKDSPFWWFSFRHDGKRIADSTGMTDYKLANQVYVMKRNKHIIRKEKGEIAPIKLRDLIQHFLDDYSKANKKSYSDDLSLAKKLNAFFGEKLASEITPQLVEQYKSHRRQQPVADRQVSGAMVNRELSFMKAVYNRGIEWGLVADNPVKRVKFFSEKDRARTRYLAAEEKTRLLAVCPPDVRRIVIFALKTGMRQSEILGLRWTDIDPVANTIELRRTKSGKIRYVPIHPDVREILNSLPRSGEFVFAGERGGAGWHGTRRAAFEKALEKAGLRDVVFHTLRHTFASELVMKGVDLKTVSELLGHSSTRMTERYSHLSPSHKAVAVNLLPSEAPAAVAEPQVLRELAGARTAGK